MQRLRRRDEGLVQLTGLVLDSVKSKHTKRAYGLALRDFVKWMGQEPLVKATINRYKSHLESRGMSASTINQRLSAVRKLVGQAADQGIVGRHDAAVICAVSGIKQEGGLKGNCLSADLAEVLVNAPDTSTLKGLRDRAMLAVMVGCGLRRSEVASLTWKQIEKQDGHWVIVQIKGKYGRIRSVTIPQWVKITLDEWREMAGESGYVFKTVNKWGQTQHESLSVDTVRHTVKRYGAMIGEPDLAPDDLRRTYARLAYKAGTDMGQIQSMLGHASPQTTERYLELC